MRRERIVGDFQEEEVIISGDWRVKHNSLSRGSVVNYHSQVLICWHHKQQRTCRAREERNARRPALASGST